MAQRKPEHYAMLLRVRKRQEDLKARDHASAHRDVLRAQGERREIEQFQRATVEKASTATRALSIPYKAHALLQYERHLALRAVEKDAHIGELQKEAGMRRAELEETMKERRMVERLIERAEEALYEETRRKERLMEDELTAIRAARGSRGIKTARRA